MIMAGTSSRKEGGVVGMSESCILINTNESFAVDFVWSSSVYENLYKNEWLATREGDQQVGKDRSSRKSE